MPLSESDIAAVMNAGVTPRMRNLEEARAYVDGTVYDGRPDFFDDGTPLRERKPCVRYPVVRNAIASYSALCLGDDKFPQITSGSSEDDSVVDPRFGLSDTDSVTLDSGIRRIVDQTRLKAVAAQVLDTELACGTSCTVVSVVRGKLRVAQIDPKVCTPTMSVDDPDTVTSLEIKYRYMTQDTWSQAEGKYVARVFVYRRVIDDTTDTTFEPVEILRVNDDPTPDQPSKGGKFAHNFGFCPVVWRRANVSVSDQQAIDGRPIHWGLYSLIDTVNLGLSQRFRAALYSGDPQLVEIGVTDEDVQVPMGRASDIRQPGVDVSGYREALQYSKRSGPSSDKRRKRGAGTVWRYESADANVKMLTLEGDALKVIADDIASNIKTLRESLGHVHIDASDLSGFGDISGKTLAFIYASQIGRCDRLREDFGSGWILATINMLLRVVVACGHGIYLAGSAKLQAVLRRFSAQVGTSETAQWFAPQIRLDWGPYFRPSDMDEQTRITTVLSALNADRPLIAYATAIAAIKSIFPDIQDPDQYLKTLLKEKAEMQAQAIASAQATMFAMGGSPDDGDPKPDASASRPTAKPKTQKLKRQPADGDAAEG